jgi:hypothetical protein
MFGPLARPLFWEHRAKMADIDYGHAPDIASNATPVNSPISNDIAPKAISTLLDPNL